MSKKSLIFLLLLLVSSFYNNPCFAKGYTYLGLQDDSFQEFFEKGNDLKRIEKYDEAIENYKKAYEINPNQMMAISELCNCFYKTNNSSELEKYAKKGLVIAQSNIVSKFYIGIFYFYLGESYKIDKKYDLAIRYLHLSILNAPYNIDSYRNCAFCLGKVKRYREAIEFYQQIGQIDNRYFIENNLKNEIEKLEKEDLDNNPVNQHFSLALKYKQQNQIDEYREELEKILEIDSENIEALACLTGESFINLAGKNKEENLKLIKYCEKALYLIDNKIEGEYFYLNLTLYKRITLLYRNIGNEEMAKEYDIAVKSYEYYEEAEKAFNKEKDIGKALSYYKKAVDNYNTDKIPYNYNLITTYIVFLGQNNKFDEYKDYIRKAIDHAKKDKNSNKLTEYAGFVAKYYSSLKQYDKAIKYYNTAFEKVNYINGKYFYKYQIAKIYIELKDIDKALNEYDECIKLVDEGAVDNYDVVSEKIKYKVFFDENSNFSKAYTYHEKGIRAFKEGKYREATENLVESLEFTPLNNNTLAYLCESLYLIKDFENSFKVAKEGLLVSDLDKNYGSYSTFCSYITKYYDEIAKDYEKGLEYSILGYTKTHSNKMLYNVGIGLVRLKKYDKAIEALKNYDYNGTPFVECLKLLGLCYEIKNQINKAYETYEKAYQLDPTDEDIAKSLSKCKERMKDMEGL